MELAFAHPTGVASRYWGAGGRASPQHVFGRRGLSEEELLKVGGGDDGGGGGDAGDCGSGGDCGADSGSCSDDGTGCAVADPNAISLPTVTVIGIAPSQFASAPDSAAMGALAGGAVGVVAFASGATGTMALGDAIALASLFGAIIAVVALGVTITGLGLLALLANAANTGDGTAIGNPMGDPSPSYGGGDGP